VVRGTIDFTTYPHALILDGGGEPSQEGMPDPQEQEGYALAMIRRLIDGKTKVAIEVQRWDVDPGEAHGTKHWLPITDLEQVDEAEGSLYTGLGLRTSSTVNELGVAEISTGLRLRRLHLTSQDDAADVTETKRNAEEDSFAARFAQAKATVLMYSSNRVQ